MTTIHRLDIPGISEAEESDATVGPVRVERNGVKPGDSTAGNSPLDSQQWLEPAPTPLQDTVQGRHDSI